MKKKTLLAVGTIIGASAFALFKTSQGKIIQKQLGKESTKKESDEKLIKE